MSITINRLGHLGDGIADGPIYVPLTLPGEIVDGDIENGTLAAPRILTPSADRVRPPCSHFKSCGGCALQHASDDFVAKWKAQIVQQALAAHGLDAPVRHIKTSPPKSRRRAVLTGRRTKKGALVGFHARKSDTVIAIPGCTLLMPEIIALLPALETLTTLGASRKGALDLSVTWSQDGADIHVSGGKPLDGPLRIELAGFAAQANIARLSWEDELVAQNRPPVHLYDGIAVTPPPGAFLQATEQGQADLISSVVDAVGTPRKIVDLFAGSGTFSLPLARHTQVHAVESDAAMLTALDTAWRTAKGLKAVTTETRDLFRRPLVPLDLAEIDTVLLDPPRAGAEAQILEITNSGVTRVAMVSCNPTTFARDAKTLAMAGFAPQWIDVIDQFRWSAHVELAALFTRDHIPGK